MAKTKNSQNPLWQIIKERGISQNRLAFELGMSAAQLSRILHGLRWPSRVKALEISKKLGIPLEELFK